MWQIGKNAQPAKVVVSVSATEKDVNNVVNRKTAWVASGADQKKAYVQRAMAPAELTHKQPRTIIYDYS